jgi:two-component system sensor histidine kinase DegS
MVKSYIEKIKENMVNERLSLLEQENDLQNDLKENVKFIQLLEETTDPNYAFFTPRDVNVYNRRRIDELNIEREDIIQKLDSIKHDIADCDCRIDEVDSVLRVIRYNESRFSSRTQDGISILEIQELERQRIARDLHDSTVQNLTSLVHKSELCMKLLETDPIRCKLELSTLNKFLRNIIQDTRSIIYDLRPMSFDDIGFDVAIEQCLDILKKGTSTKITYKKKGECYKLDNIVAISLLRVIQEACSNSIKHANASNIWVSLNYQAEQLVLSITDNGDGFDVSVLPKVSREDYSGFGLSMMKERVFLLSGTIDIKSEIGNGCSIVVKIPMKEDK